MNRYICIIVCIIINFMQGECVLPPGFLICKQSDPDINECLLKAVHNALLSLKNGEISLNFPQIQPMKLAKWTIPAGDLVNFEQPYTNLEIYNIPNFIINRVRRAVTGKTANFIIQAFNPEFIFEADYIFQDALVGTFNMTSQGRAKLIYSGFEADLNITGDFITKDGSKYLSITDFDSYNHAQSISMDMKTGDPEFDKEFNNFGSDNWIHLFTDTKHHYAEIYSTLFKSLADTLFSAVPFDVLFPK